MAGCKGGVQRTFQGVLQGLSQGMLPAGCMCRFQGILQGLMQGLLHIHGVSIVYCRKTGREEKASQDNGLLIKKETGNELQCFFFVTISPVSAIVADYTSFFFFSRSLGPCFSRLSLLAAESQEL